MNFIAQLLRGIIVLFLTLIGLGIAFTLLCIGLISIIGLFLVKRFRGQQFSASQYWQASRERAQRTRSQFSERFCQPNYRRRPPQDISDVDVRELK